MMQTDLMELRLAPPVNEAIPTIRIVACARKIAKVVEVN